MMMGGQFLVFCWDTAHTACSISCFLPGGLPSNGAGEDLPTWRNTRGQKLNLG